MKGLSPIISIILLLLLVVAATGGYTLYVTGLTDSTKNKYEQNIVYPQNPPIVQGIHCFPGYGWFDVVDSGTSGINGTVIQALSGDISKTSNRVINISSYGRIYFGLPGQVGNTINVKLYTPHWEIAERCTVREDKDLRLHLLFDEGTGATTQDSSPYDATVAKSEPVWVSGLSGYALDFNGTSDFVQVTIDKDLYAIEHMSTCIWFNASDTSTGSYQTLIVRNGANSWDLLLDPTGKLYGEIRTKDGTYNSIIGSTVSNDLLWNLACLTFNGTTISLYLNGTLDNQTVHTSPGLLYQHITQDINIGGGWTTYWYGGALDGVHIYDEALPADAIYALYEAYN
ncbi:MAG: LamG domain-containing protein [Candidatus Altiarchaeota archaeon]|nr:LamG domain-containing protein [Candidatus Altiarchaeota archaeon]